MKVKVKKLKDTATIPTRGSKFAAGYDLYACIENNIQIPAHQTVKIGTGLSFELPEGYFAAIVARSGLATKESLRPANCIGICDEDYRGEYIVALHNDSDLTRIVSPNERIAQMILLPYQNIEFNEIETLNETDRGSGGFGSSGK